MNKINKSMESLNVSFSDKGPSLVHVCSLIEIGAWSQKVSVKKSKDWLSPQDSKKTKGCE